MVCFSNILSIQTHVIRAEARLTYVGRQYLQKGDLN